MGGHDYQRLDNFTNKCYTTLDHNDKELIMGDLEKKVMVVITNRQINRRTPVHDGFMIGGYPISAFSIEAAVKAKAVGKVIFFYKNEDEINCLRLYESNFPNFMFLKDNPDRSIDSILKYALEIVKDDKNYDPTHIIHLSTQYPFRPELCIEEFISKTERISNYDAIYSVLESNHHGLRELIFEDNQLIQQKYDGKNINRINQPAVWYPGYLDCYSSESILNNSIKISKSSKISGLSPSILTMMAGNERKFYNNIFFNHQDEFLTPIIPNLLLKEIKFVVLDFDGVFTDNKITVNEDGRESVVVNSSDGLGLDMIRDRGYIVAVISAGDSLATKARCEYLGLPHFLGIKEKDDVLKNIVDKHNLKMEKVVYLGNDINDLSCMKLAGCGVAVADAHKDVLNQADFILTKAGGSGAIRELCDLILANRQ
jgi:YrbI family 3-deoxy-D-manno-octulosonate 8-phosphate phosphatase